MRLRVSGITESSFELESLGATQLSGVGPLRCLVLAVKTFQVQASLALLAAFFKRSSIVVLTQNGVAAIRHSPFYFENIVQLILTGVCQTENAFGVRETLRGTIHGAYVCGNPAQDFLRNLSRDLGEAGSPSWDRTVVDEIVYPKLLLASTGALMVKRGLSIQQLLKNSDARREGYNLLLEGLAVFTAAFEAACAGFSSEVVRRAGMVVHAWAECRIPGIAEEQLSSSDAFPSICQDVRRGRHITEVGDLNGEIVRLGRQHGLGTPLNSELLRFVLGITAGSPAQ